MARRRKGRDISGWLVLDKPCGISSNHALGKVRHAFDAKKAGHAGTLDPMASGILPIAFGEATKTIPYMMDASKGYDFTISFGQSTDTLDAEGEVTASSDARPAKDRIAACLAQFVGQIEQMPPAFSALHVDGKRAYELARAGEKVALKCRIVTVFDLHLVAMPDADHAQFSVTCGKGTYVRALARDICAALGVEGHVNVLRRTRVGPFTENNSLPLDEVAKKVHIAPAAGPLLPLTTALDDIPACAVNESEARDLRQGRAIALGRQGDLPTAGDNPVLALMADQAVALCHVRDGQLRPFRVFNETQQE